MAAKAVVYLKKPFEMAGGAYNVIYGTPSFSSPGFMGGTECFSIGTLATGLTFSIPVDNVSAVLWESEDGLIDAILSTFIDDSGVLGYVALS